MKQYFFLTALCLALGSFGQQGSFDSSFASKGWTATTLGTSTQGNPNAEYGKKITLQANGKSILLLQTVQNAVFVRYNTDGTLDKTFGIDGFSTPVFLGAETAALQSDGKIVLLGQSWVEASSSYDFTVVRFNTDGTLDNSFGVAGKVVTDISNTTDYPYAMAIQPDGKIVISGGASSTYETQTALVRYNTDGTLDNSFGTSGKKILELSTFGQEIHAITIQSDGKIIVGGFYVSLDSQYDFVLARLNTDGSFDTNFNSTGIAQLDFGSWDQINSIVIQSDGKIVAGGYSGDGSSNDFAIARFNSDGTVDNAFASSGQLKVDFAADDDQVQSLVLQSDGKILACGSAYMGTNSYDFALIRLGTDGSFDNTFGTGGKVTTDFFTNWDQSRSVAIQSDGKILIAGYAANAQGDRFAIARYNTNGSLDNSFNGAGKLVSWYPQNKASQARAVTVQSDGKVVVAGFSHNGTNSDFAITRYNTDGTLDNSFGTGGVVITDMYGSWDEAYAVAVRPDGKIVVGGFAYPEGGSAPDCALACYNADGTLYNSFGSGGKVSISFSTAYDAIHTLATQADGKIVVAGSSENGGGNSFDFIIARYSTTGVLDNTFGTEGKIIENFPGDDRAYAIQVQADGKIIVGGQSDNNTSQDFAFARYSGSGVLDPSFGTAGKLKVAFAGSRASVRSMAFQGDGKLVAGGLIENDAGTNDFALVRCNTDGSLDNTFGDGGKVVSDFSGSYDEAYAIAIQQDGKIIAAGVTNNNESMDDCALIRYNGDGTLDNAFGTLGRVTNNLFGQNEKIYGIALANNRIYAAGAIMGLYNNVYTLLAAYKGFGVPSGVPLITINDVTVDENAGTASLGVTLNKPAASTITVNYTTADSTATSKGRNADYKSLKGSLSIAPGNTTASINIGVKSDNQSEKNEYFKVVLSLTRKMLSLAGFTDSVGIVTITDAPAPAGFIEELVANNSAGENNLLKTKLDAKATPNPTSTSFTLRLESGSSLPVTITVTDVSGRRIEVKQVPPNRSIELGMNYKPGVYYVQLNQGVEKRVLKLVKQS